MKEEDRRRTEAVERRAKPKRTGDHMSSIVLRSVLEVRSERVGSVGQGERVKLPVVKTVRQPSALLSAVNATSPVFHFKAAYVCVWDWLGS